MWDDSGEAVIAALALVDRNSRWNVTQQSPLDFPCFHTQGITRAGDRIFVSSVEIGQAPIRFTRPLDGMDRGPGAGTAHLFELDGNGQLIRQATLGEGTIYHPGGIDLDTSNDLWVPVAEYRPDSRAIVYRVGINDFQAEEAFRFPDHIGGIVHDSATGLLHAVTWGSRRLLSLTPQGQLLHETTNKSHLVDFQGCVTVHNGGMVCTGVTEYQTGQDAVFQLGSAAVVDTGTGYIRLEVPVTMQSHNGRVLTYNAAHLDTDGRSLRMLVADEGGPETPGHLITVETVLR